MKQIQNPSNWKLSIALLPLIVVMVIVIVMRTVPVWAIAVGVISLLTYLSLLAYFCIKQKCYNQLLTNIIVIILWIIFYLVQFK